MEQAFSSITTVLGVVNPLLTFVFLIVGISLVFFLKAKLEGYFRHIEDISASLRIMARGKDTKLYDWEK